MKQFKIKAEGKHSVIIDEPSMLIIPNETIVKNVQSEQMCEDFGSVYDSHTKKCPNCGSVNLKYKNRK